MRDATPPRSGAQLSRAFSTGGGAPEVSKSSPAVVARCRAARRGTVPDRAWDSQARGINRNAMGPDVSISAHGGGMQRSRLELCAKAAQAVARLASRSLLLRECKSCASG
eukprot:365509-Chlamydomonas_euryale.AAC.12